MPFADADIRADYRSSLEWYQRAGAKAVYQQLLASAAGRFSVKQRTTRIAVVDRQQPRQFDFWDAKEGL
jgi:hypothetical protein